MAVFFISANDFLCTFAYKYLNYAIIEFYPGS